MQSLTRDAERFLERQGKPQFQEGGLALASAPINPALLLS